MCGMAASPSGVPQNSVCPSGGPLLMIREWMLLMMALSDLPLSSGSGPGSWPPVCADRRCWCSALAASPRRCAERGSGSQGESWDSPRCRSSWFITGKNSMLALKCW